MSPSNPNTFDAAQLEDSQNGASLSPSQVLEMESRLGAVLPTPVQAPSATEIAAYLMGSLSMDEAAALERCITTQSKARHQLLFAKQFLDLSQQPNPDGEQLRKLEVEDAGFFQELELAWAAWTAKQEDHVQAAETWWKTYGFETVMAQAALGIAEAVTAMQKFRQFGQQLASALSRPSYAWSRGSDGQDRLKLEPSPCRVESVEVTSSGDLKVYIAATPDTEVRLDETSTITLSLHLPSIEPDLDSSWEIASLSSESLPMEVTAVGVGSALGIPPQSLPPDCVRITVNK